MLLSVATVWLVYHLAMSLTGNRVVALAAGSFLAIEPLSITYTSYLMPETLFTLLLVLFIMALIAYFRTNSLVYLVLGRRTAGRGHLCPPDQLLLPPIFAYGRFSSRLLAIGSAVAAHSCAPVSSSPCR